MAKIEWNKIAKASLDEEDRAHKSHPILCLYTFLLAWFWNRNFCFNFKDNIVVLNCPTKTIFKIKLFNQNFDQRSKTILKYICKNWQFEILTVSYLIYCHNIWSSFTKTKNSIFNILCSHFLSSSCSKVHEIYQGCYRLK